MFTGQFNRASQRIIITPAAAAPDTTTTKEKTNHATTQVSGQYNNTYNINKFHAHEHTQCVCVCTRTLAHTAQLLSCSLTLVIS